MVTFGCHGWADFRTVIQRKDGKWRDVALGKFQTHDDSIRIRETPKMAWCEIFVPLDFAGDPFSFYGKYQSRLGQLVWEAITAVRRWMLPSSCSELFIRAREGSRRCSTWTNFKKSSQKYWDFFYCFWNQLRDSPRETNLTQSLENRTFYRFSLSLVAS